MKRQPGRGAGGGVSCPRVILRRNLVRSLHEGHPWLFREALEIPPGLPAGAVVDVVQRDGRFVARGLLDPGSPLAVRVYSLLPEEPLDEELVARRLAGALAARRGLLQPDRTTAYRWCNGEGDFLPGVVLDRYGPLVVLRLDGEAVRSLRPAIGQAVRLLGAPDGVQALVERARHGQAELLWGEAPAGPVEVLEHGHRFAVDVLAGQKTGFFLDQRENRRLVGELARGLSVANLFAYTGGFSVYAARGGARRVETVDLARPAIGAARENFRRNGLPVDAHGFFAEDAFAWLDRTVAARTRYDLVIVDPPSFAPSAEALPRALAAYTDLFTRALAVVAPGGLLAAASCSSHVDERAFLGVLKEAGRRVRRPLRLLGLSGQPADHPVPPGFPEGRYLKFAVLRADCRDA